MQPPCECVIIAERWICAVVLSLGGCSFFCPGADLFERNLPPVPPAGHEFPFEFLVDGRVNDSESISDDAACQIRRSAAAVAPLKTGRAMVDEVWQRFLPAVPDPHDFHVPVFPTGAGVAVGDGRGDDDRVGIPLV